MKNKLKKYAVHPGVFIRDELEVLCMTADQFASATKLTKETVQGLIDLEVDITKDTAEKLANYFDSSVEYWLRAQESYNDKIKKY